MPTSQFKIPSKRILIVNCFFDPLRISIGRRFKIPQSTAPAYLAGMFARAHCEIKLYDEALAIEPDMTDAKENKKAVEELLKKQDQQKSEGDSKN